MTPDEAGPVPVQSDSPAAHSISCNGKHCDCDGCGSCLTGRQERFCGDAHKNEWHDLYRPRLASPVVGHPRKGTIRALVLGVLTDGEWHSAHDLAQKTHAGEHSIKARLSELRRAGHNIVSDLPNGNWARPHRYRLVP